MTPSEVESLVRRIVDELARAPAGAAGTRRIGTGPTHACAGNDARLNGVAPIGSVLPYGGTSAPANWLLCDGTAISRTTYASLFAVLGTAYGAGNGTTTFNLPNLRGRFPLGKAASGTGSTLGGTGGAIDHTHGPGTFSVTVPGEGAETAGQSPKTVGADGAVSVTGTSGTANPPFQTVNYIVRAT